jgi:hypothetical protein
MTIEAPEPEDFPAELVTAPPKKKAFLRRRGMLLSMLLSLTLGATAIAMAAGPFSLLKFRSSKRRVCTAIYYSLSYG